ncbi:MAG: outer membrane protein transport protein, partial [Candidatus Eisenbacteria sp.]|nr:outer membrane protein transport protein [Candidatus Eisenbacteria bacterium]
MSRKRLTYIPVLAGVLAALASPLASRADSGFVAPLDEVPLTNALATGARAAGMGFVSMAVADDATAITSNPAAMARLNRIELSGGFRRGSLGIDGEMSGSEFVSDLSGTDLSSLRFAYPFPTFRGSLVLGFSAERIYDFAGDRLAAYDGEIEWDEHPHVDGPDSIGVWHNEEDYVSDGGITALSVACALEVSPTVSLGVALSYLVGEYSRGFVWDVYDDLDLSETYNEVHLQERSEADITGFRGTIGGLFYVMEGLSVGVAVDTPTGVTFDGTRWDYARMVMPDSTTVGEGSEFFSDKVTLPFAFRAGVAYAPADFIVVGADLSYSDWSEMDYAGRITETEEGAGLLQRRAFYDEKVGYGVGAELTVPSWPLRIRGGYAYRPIVYNGLDVTTDRYYFTLGAGILIDTVLAIDVAWMQGGYERVDTDPRYAYVESVDDSGL